MNNELNEQIREFDKLKNKYEKKLSEVNNNYKEKTMNPEKEINEKKIE